MNYAGLRDDRIIGMGGGRTGGRPVHKQLIMGSGARPVPGKAWLDFTWLILERPDLDLIYTWALDESYL